MFEEHIIRSIRGMAVLQTIGITLALLMLILSNVSE